MKTLHATHVDDLVVGDVIEDERYGTGWLFVQHVEQVGGTLDDRCLIRISSAVDGSGGWTVGCSGSDQVDVRR